MSAPGMLSGRQLEVIVIAVTRFVRIGGFGPHGRFLWFEEKNVPKILTEGAGIVSWNCELEVFAKHAVARVHEFGLPRSGEVGLAHRRRAACERLSSVYHCACAPA